MPFHSAAAVERTTRAMEQVINGVPCHHLWFAPDRSVIDVLTRHMD
jgi:hypothetical protein